MRGSVVPHACRRCGSTRRRTATFGPASFGACSPPMATKEPLCVWRWWARCGFTEDGHELVNLGGRELWRPRIDEFLEVIGAPNRDGDPGDAAVPNWDPPPALAPADHPAWRRYLGFGGHKAFAMGQGGRFGWAAHRVTPELARSHALRFCESELDVCRIISVAGEQPVETNPSPSLDVDGSPTGY